MAGSKDRTVTIIKVIAWIAIVGGGLGGVFTLFGSIFSLLNPLKFDRPGADPQLVAEMAFYMKVNAVLGLVKVPLYFAGLAGGLGLLQRSAWSRPLMEGLGWTFMVLTLVVFRSSALWVFYESEVK